MTVPDATGYDLLKEHAYLQYGSKEFQSVLNFDYSFAIDQFVSHRVIGFKSINTITLLSIIIILVLYITSTSTSSNPSISSQSLEYEYDIESGPPSLSHSNTSTPTNSPNLTKDLFRSNTFRFDDYQPHKHE